MAKRRFEVTMTFVIEVDRKLIVEGMSKEFAECIVPLTSPERVAEHLAYNLIQHTDVSSLDGFALHQDDEAAIDWRSITTEARPL